MQYRFSFADPSLKYIDIEFTAGAIGADQTIIHLPSWRPGRYELGNFAKNIQKWRPYDLHGKELPFRKISKSSWEVETKNVSTLIIKYNYYAAQLDAGACWLDHEQLYVNPIHCCLFMEERINEACTVQISLPADWKIATSMQQTGPGTFYAEDYHELVDSPFIASPSLKHLQYNAEGKNFHIHIQGDYEPDTQSLLSDFKGFTELQLAMMGGLPETFKGNAFNDYHFLVQALPFEFYHGVEHLKSTVLAIGEGKDLHKRSLYTELLGVASHELFHVWNIKNIRPAEMLPYDYTRENYASTGYVYEGVTTYYGDLFLARSGFFSFEEYLREIATRYQKHVRNPGRFNYSVSQSSFDTWLDGYTLGVPARKTSIYDEGSLIALMIDFIIMKNTHLKKSLDDVMRRMFSDFGKKGKGYTANDFKLICEEVGECSFEDFFKEYVDGANSYENKLRQLFEFAGLRVIDTSAEKCSESFYGFLTKAKDGKHMITNVAHGSPAHLAWLKTGDEIISVNNAPIGDDIQNLLATTNVVRLKIVSSTTVKEPELKKDVVSYYPLIKIEPGKSATKEQLNFLNKWCGFIAENKMAL